MTSISGTSATIRFPSAAAMVALLALGSADIARAEGCHNEIWHNYTGDPGTVIEVCPDGTRTPNYDVYQDKWVAIALSPATLASGASWQNDTSQEAERVALADCRKFASDCVIKLSRINMCLVLATSLPDRAWGIDLDRNAKRAEAKALAQCQSRGGRDCKVQENPCAHD